MERNETETPHGQIMLGILVVQDLALGLMLWCCQPSISQLNLLAWRWGGQFYRLGYLLGAVVVGIWIIPPYCGS
jgi:CPA2 family monovalent cation:H+ antiporter-2